MSDLLVMAVIGGRRCAMHACDVQSVIELGAITPVPRSPDFVAGIAALRSQALTVIDCRTAIGLDPQEFPADPRAAVVHVGGHAYALMVDAIEDITTAITHSNDVTGGFGEQWSRIATGMVETAMGPALLVDLSAIITTPEALPNAA